MEGYLHPLYAQSFSAIGMPLFSPKSNRWLIKGQKPDTPYFDAIGPYPLFLCEHREQPSDELETLKERFVSVALVAGPFLKTPVNNSKKNYDFF
ncbi:MAG TPA: hypothetical protein PLQ69_07225 [Paludibacter sp.]|nr:hypothetical protein [Paludibacter sp.]